MPLLRTQRMLNAIETGNIDSTALATLMEDEGRVSELSLLMGMPGAARRIAQSDIVVNTIADVEAAAKVAGKNSVMLDALAERSDAFKKLAQSTYWSGDQDIVLELLRRATTAKAILDLNETRGSVASVACTYTAVTALSTTKFLVVYSGTSGYLWAVAVSLVDGVTTVGTPVQINSVASTYLSVTAISDTQAVVSYTSSYCTACVISVSGLTVTFGTPGTVYAVASSYTSIVKLTNTKVFVVYKYTSGATYGNVLTISGTSFSVGANCTVSSTGFDYVSAVALSETSVVVVGVYSGTVYSVAVSVSGTTATAGSSLTVFSSASTYTTVVKLTDTKAAICFKSSDNYIQAGVLTIAGITVSVGTVSAIDTLSSASGTPTYLTTTPLAKDKFILAYRTATSGSCRINIVSLVNDVPIITTLVFPGILPTYMLAAPLDGYRTVIAYRDDGTTYPSFTVVGA